MNCIINLPPSKKSGATLDRIAESQEKADREAKQEKKKYDKRMKKLGRAVHQPMGRADGESGGRGPGSPAAKNGIYLSRTRKPACKAAITASMLSSISWPRTEKKLSWWK